MFKHIISTIVLGWLIASSAAAQETGTITGAVSADGTDYPLAGAVVRVVGFDNLGAVTDARGGFRIERVPIGPQRIRVENYGWEPVDRTVTVAVGVTEVRVRMPEAPVHVAGVTVTASGAAQRQMSSSAAVGAVTGRELRETKPSHPAQIAARIAGVWVNVAGSGEGHMTAIRQPLTTNPVYLYLEDGVPTRSTGFFNHNALYEINVPQAGRMEVLKGPGTALYGSDAIGGVINVETHAPAERASAELFAETGSSGWSRGLFSLSDTRGANGVRADLNLTRWDGWRDASGYDRHSGTIRWDHAIDASTKLKTVVSYSSIDQLDPSALSRSEYEANPKLNYYLFTTRNIRALRASTTLDVERGETHVLFTPYVRDNRMELVPFWMLAFDPVTYETGHKSVGMLLRVRQKLPQLKTTLTSGVDVDYSPGFRDEHQITMQRQGAIFESYQIGPLVYDYDVTFRGASPYAQAEFAPSELLHLTAGLRYDRVRYGYETHLDTISVGRYRRPADTTVNYEQVSPKLGIAWEAALWLGTFASYRESFRAPSESQIFRQGSSINTTSLKPIRARAYEIGVRGVVAHRFDYEVSAYDMRVKDDVLTFVRTDGVRETQNAGETRHRGIEVGAGAQLADWLRLDVAQTWTRHTYEAWRPRPTLSYAGHDIERAPHTITNLRVRLKPAGLNGANATAEWQRIGRYWEDPENTHPYEGHSLINLNGNVPLKWGVTAVLRIVNVTNTHYAESATFTAAELEQLTPGAPRLIYIGAQRSWPR